MQNKEQLLKRHKRYATGLLLIIAILLVVLLYWQHVAPATWHGYAIAFCEASVVGALADWFAVTALFRHPLGLKIPHTNLIAQKQKQIGSNLGSFVEKNFLTPQVLRHYIQNWNISETILQQLNNTQNRQQLLREVLNIGFNIIQKTDDKKLAGWIKSQINEKVETTALNQHTASLIQYLIHSQYYPVAFNYICQQLKSGVEKNNDLIQQLVKQHTSQWVPAFLDQIIANKLSETLLHFLDDLGKQEDHPLRIRLHNGLANFASEIQSQEEWNDKLQKFTQDILANDKADEVLNLLISYFKKMLMDSLTPGNDATLQKLDSFLVKYLNDWTSNAENITQLNKWIQFHLYRIIVRNTHLVSSMISNTVDKWDSQQLNKTLELEVGKDLQFIRINGTLVGGLVGITLYTIGQLLKAYL